MTITVRARELLIVLKERATGIIGLLEAEWLLAAAVTLGILANSPQRAILHGGVDDVAESEAVRRGWN